MLQRYFSLRDNKASAPLSAAWIETLTNMINEDSDGIEVFSSHLDCSWLYAIRIWTVESNFTDNVKKDIVPQMCDPRMNLGPCWQEINSAQFHAMKHEIKVQEVEKARKEAEFKAKQSTEKDPHSGMFPSGASHGSDAHGHMGSQHFYNR